MNDGVYSPVWDALPPNGERVSAIILMQTIGINNERELYKQIQNERLAGRPIIGHRDNGGGFSRAVDRSEVLRMYKRCRRIAGVEFAKMKRLRKYLKTVPGQQKLDFPKK